MLLELQNFGLSQEESKIYVACLEIWWWPVSVIAKRAWLNRVSCYHTLDKLLDKKLLSIYNKDWIKCYAPEDPSKLEQLALEKVNLAKMLIPQILSISNVHAFKPKIRFYEWRQWIERVFNESLESEWEILWYSNLKIVCEFFPDFFKDYCHKKIEKKIRSRYLSTNVIWDVNLMKNFLPKKYDPNLIEILLVNNKQFLFENEIMIFWNKVWIISFKKWELMSLIVESWTFANSMKAIYDLAWLWATAFVAN